MCLDCVLKQIFWKHFQQPWRKPPQDTKKAKNWLGKHKNCEILHSDTELTLNSGKELGTAFATDIGVPQGDGWSPRLFIIFPYSEETLSSRFQTDHSCQQDFSTPGTNEHYDAETLHPTGQLTEHRPMTGTSSVTPMRRLKWSSQLLRKSLVKKNWQ